MVGCDGDSREIERPWFFCDRLLNGSRFPTTPLRVGTEWERSSSGCRCPLGTGCSHRCSTTSRWLGVEGTSRTRGCLPILKIQHQTNIKQIVKGVHIRSINLY